MRKILKDTRAEIEEAVFVLPVLLLVTFGLINLAMVGFAGLSAANAANYGARMASVAQANQAGIAVGLPAICWTQPQLEPMPSASLAAVRLAAW